MEIPLWQPRIDLSARYNLLEINEHTQNNSKTTHFQVSDLFITAFLMETFGNYYCRQEYSIIINIIITLDHVMHWILSGMSH